MLKDIFNRPDTQNVVKWIHYLDIYDTLFSRFRGEKVTILEIGILDGGSLKLWRDYFGDKATVVGVDLTYPCLAFESNGIHIEVGDQSDPLFMNSLIRKYGKFDIVIDDGGHTNHLVRKSFDLLFNSTNHLYIVEDTHALLWHHGFYSLYRDLYIIFNQNFNIFKKFINFINLFYSFIVGDYFFYNYSLNMAKKITSKRHQKPYKEFKKGDKLSFSPDNLSKDIKNLNSIQFYDSLIVFYISSPNIFSVEFK